MTRTGALAVLVFAIALLPASARAANKEHQLLMAEIRMLQEQQQELRQMIGGLSDTLKAINARLDTDAGRAQKAFADQRLVLENIAEAARILREKADDTNVRLSTMTQEVQALRQTMTSMPSTAPVAPTAPTGETPTGEPAVQPSSGAAPTIQAPPANISPTRMYDQAYADYMAGQYELAVEGFQAFIRTFPSSPNADDAQLNIGNSLYGAGKFKEAVAAFQKVISDYPQTESVAPAYYKMGLSHERLNQPEAARRAYETVVKNYPNSLERTLATQRLEAMKK